MLPGCLVATGVVGASHEHTPEHESTPFTRPIKLIQPQRTLPRISEGSSTGEPSEKPCQPLLVTGGAGFIGGHTASLALDLGWDVRILDNLSTGRQETVEALEAKGANFIMGDVRDEAVVNNAVDGCDAVAHFAAQVSVPRSVEHPKKRWTSTLEGHQRSCLPGPTMSNGS